MATKKRAVGRNPTRVTLPGPEETGRDRTRGGSDLGETSNRIDRRPTYVEKKAPSGKSFWVNPKSPHEGYLVDPSKNPGAVAYPIEYINWILRAGAPTGGEVRRSASGKEGREIGGLALGGKVGIVYGQTRVAPSIFFGPRNLPTTTYYLVVGYGLSHGPCDSLVDTIFPHGKTATEMRNCGGSGASAAYQDTFYPGLISPPSADPNFVASVLGSDPATFERYPGLCYVSARLIYYDSGCWTGIPGSLPMPLFVLKGRKVRNYATGLDAWTDNPAYCLADYITSRQYGRAAQVNVQSVIDAAAYCDETFLNTATGLQEKKHQMDLYIGRPANHQSHIDAMRAHFRCSVIERGGELVFIIDKDSAPVAEFDETMAVPVTVERLGGSGTPNTVIVTGVDPSKNYDMVSQSARTSAVEAGLAIPRDVEYPLEGLTRDVHRASEAYYLLNSRLNNLRVVLRAVHPKARALEPNDIIEYTSSSFGLSGFLLRVLRVTRSSDGAAWMVECAGHNPAIYGFQHRSVETYPLPSLPDPHAAIDPPEDITMTERFALEGEDYVATYVDIGFTPHSEAIGYGGSQFEYRLDGGEWMSLPLVDSGPIIVSVPSGPGTTIETRGYTMNRLTRTLGAASAIFALTIGAIPLEVYPTAYDVLTPTVDLNTKTLSWSAPQVRSEPTYGPGFWSGTATVDQNFVNDGDKAGAIAATLDPGETLILDLGVGNAKEFRQVRISAASNVLPTSGTPFVIATSPDASAYTNVANPILRPRTRTSFVSVTDEIVMQWDAPGTKRAWRITNNTASTLQISEVQFATFEGEWTGIRGVNVYDMRSGTALLAFSLLSPPGVTFGPGPQYIEQWITRASAQNLTSLLIKSVNAAGAESDGVGATTATVHVAMDSEAPVDEATPQDMYQKNIYDSLFHGGLIESSEIDLGSTTFTGNVGDINSTISGPPIATVTGTETFFNKTISLADNSLSGSIADFNAALTGGDFATLAGVETLSSKTLASSSLNLATNTLTGTKAEFDAALSDDNFAYRATTQTFTAPQTVNVSTTGIAFDVRQTGASGFGQRIIPGNDANYAFAINNAANTAQRHALYGSGDAIVSLGAGNFGIGGSSFGGGVGCQYVNNAATVPTSNPSSGSLIYAQAGALKARGTSGTVTTMANADPHCPVCGSDVGGLERVNHVDGYFYVCLRCLIEDMNLAGKPYVVMDDHPTDKPSKRTGQALAKAVAEAKAIAAKTRESVKAEPRAEDPPRPTPNDDDDVN